MIDTGRRRSDIGLFPHVPHKEKRSLLRRAGPLLVVAAFVLAILYRLVLLGESLYWGDLFLYFYPLEHVIRESLLNGQLPLWNRFILCGQPLIGNPQSWVFYPSTILLAFLPVSLYFTVNTALHLTLAGFFSYLYLRRICADRLGAILGSMTYAGSGFLIARLQFPTMVQTATYLPALLLLIDRMVDRPRVGTAALLALSISLLLLAGHAQLAYMSLACAASYSAARLYQIRRHRLRLGTFLRWMLLAVPLGVMAATVQLLPALQLFWLSTREQLEWAQANRFVLLPEQLINFFLPNYFGSPTRGDYWGAGNAWEPCVYIGILPLGLAMYAVVHGVKRLAVRFYLVLTILSLWLAMGKYGGLYWVAYYIVPGLASFHDPARFTFLATFALTTLAAVGMRRLRDRGMSNRIRITLVALAAVNLWWFSAHFNPTLDPRAFTYRPRVLADTPAAGKGRVFTALRDQVWQKYVNYTDYGPRSTRYAHELADTFAPNIGMRYGVEEGSGYEPVPVHYVTEVDGLLRAALARQSPTLSNLLGLFNVRLLLLPDSTRYPHPALVPLHARGVSAFAVRDPFPRAWLVRQTRRVEGTQRVLATLSAPDFDPRQVAIVSGSGGLREELPLPWTVNVNESSLPDPITRSPSSERFEADVDAGDRPVFLIWSATFYPGWTATIDGRPTRVERTNHAFTGIVVPPGRHTVVFEYKPFVIRLAIYLSLLAWAVIAFGLSVGIFCRPCRTHQVKRIFIRRGNQAIMPK